MSLVGSVSQPTGVGNPVGSMHMVVGSLPAQPLLRGTRAVAYLEAPASVVPPAVASPVVVSPSPSDPYAASVNAKDAGSKSRFAIESSNCHVVEDTLPAGARESSQFRPLLGELDRFFTGQFALYAGDRRLGDVSGQRHGLAAIAQRSDPLRAQRPVQILEARLGSLQLAAGGLGQQASVQQHHVLGAQIQRLARGLFNG